MRKRETKICLGNTHDCDKVEDHEKDEHGDFCRVTDVFSLGRDMTAKSSRVGTPSLNRLNLAIPSKKDDSSSLASVHAMIASEMGV